MWHNISENNFLILREVNYFKKFISTLFKLLVYYLVSKKYVIYQKTDLENNNKLDIEIKFLKKFEDTYQFILKLNNMISQNFLKMRLKNI